MVVKWGVLAGVVLALLLVGCGSSGGHAKPSASSSAGVSFSTDQQRDAGFVAALGKSPNAGEYAAKTAQDLVQYAHDLCQQLTSPPGNGVNDIVGMTQDPAAQQFFGHLAAATYCPNAESGVANLLGG